MKVYIVTRHDKYDGDSHKYVTDSPKLAGEYIAKAVAEDYAAIVGFDSGAEHANPIAKTYSVQQKELHREPPKRRGYVAGLDADLAELKDGKAVEETL